jgi:hypothetical protein
MACFLVFFKTDGLHMMRFRTVQFCSQVCAILSASVTVEISVQQYGLRSSFLDVMPPLKHLISALI